MEYSVKLQWVFLWSDYFFLSLLFFISASFVMGFRNELAISFWNRIFHRPIAIVAFVIILLYLIVAVLDSLHFYQTVTVDQSTEITELKSVLDSLIPTSWQQEESTYISPGTPDTPHWLGTNKIGQDVLYLCLKSIRTALLIGTLSSLIMLPLALFLGCMAGFIGGWVDDAVQYLYTTLNSIPGILLIAASILSLQVFIDNHEAWFTTLEQRADARLLALCGILGITSWTNLCRLLRGEALKIRELDYVLAARVLGVSVTRIIMRHLIPNVMPIVFITLVLDFSGLVLAESVLSYVGIGVDPTMISWGNMINNARLELARVPTVWWPVTGAFLFMFLLVLSINIFADSVRDAWDPYLRAEQAS